ncbi:Gag-Pro-Pol polyprotein [Turdus rufiventris]|nr:Gag-Pro-Pol polyprotein [Turdus rufiventris]
MRKQEPEGKGEESPRPNQGACPRTLPFKEGNSPKGRRRRERRERGQSPSKSHRRPETPHHSTSSSESDEDHGYSRYPKHYCSQPRWDTKRGYTKRYPSTSDSDSDIEKIPADFTKLMGLSAFHAVKKGSQKPMLLMDWKEIQMVCADIAPSAALAFPVRQSESESFTKFVDRLQAAVDASDLPAEAKGPVVASCLRQQCNQTTKEILRSVPPGAGIAAMIKHVTREENLAPVQAAVGAALAPIPAAVGAVVAKGDKFTLRATETYPSPPIKLTWKSSDPVWVEQWPIPEPRMSIPLQLVQQELEKGHIEPSSSPWNTLVFVIPKRSSEGFRLLHNLRIVNKKIQPMGPVQTQLPSNSFILTNQPCAVLDVKDCFFSIPLHEQEKERFAFSIVFPNGQQPNLRFHWKVLPKEIINSPTICQIITSRAVAPVRSANPEATIIQCMDDILIAAPTPSHVDNLVSAISEVLKTNGFEIVEAKIKRGPSVTFLGVKIGGSYVTPPTIKIRHNIRTLHDAQQLVGSLQWLRNIVLIPPEIMSPLYNLLKGKHPWEQKTLSEKAAHSLDFIEQQLPTAVLSQWNPSLPLDLYVHFTKEGGVGALAQGLPDTAKPVQWVVLGRTTHAFTPGTECGRHKNDGSM